MGNTRERSAKGITNQGRLTTTNPARLADHRQQERPAQVTVRGLREEHRHNLKGVWISLYESSVNLIISVNVPLVCRRRLGRVWILWIYNPHGRNSYTLGNPDGLRNSWDNGGRKHPPVQDTALLSNPQIIWLQWSQGTGVANDFGENLCCLSRGAVRYPFHSPRSSMIELRVRAFFQVFARGGSFGGGGTRVTTDK